MDAKDILIGREYAYRKSQKGTVRYCVVTGKGMRRYSESARQYLNDGVEVQLYNKAGDKLDRMVVPARRIVSRWEENTDPKQGGHGHMPKDKQGEGQQQGGKDGEEVEGQGDGEDEDDGKPDPKRDHSYMQDGAEEDLPEEDAATVRDARQTLHEIDVETKVGKDNDDEVYVAIPLKDLKKLVAVYAAARVVLSQGVKPGDRKGVKPTHTSWV